MLRLSECIFVSDIEFIVINIVQKHIDTAEIVCGNVALLPEKALTHLVFSKNFGGFQYLEIVLALTALGRAFNAAKDSITRT